MKIGYVLKQFPRLSETFILTEILELERLGCEVTIFSRHRPDQEVPHAALKNLKADVIHLESQLQDNFWEPFVIHRRLAARYGEQHGRALDVALSYRSRRELRYWLLAAQVAEESVRRGLQFLHSHFATGSASVARYVSRITALPYGVTAHAKDIYLHTVDSQRLRAVLQDAAVPLTISDANAAYLRKLAPDANLRRVYNGLDLTRFNNAKGIPSQAELVVLCIARLVEKKGIPVLLEAIHRLRADGMAIRCRIVGTGPDEAALREQCQSLDIASHVEFCGTQSQETIIERHFRQASVVVLPCVVAEDGDRDGLPTTLLEAMACGVPVVSTDLPGVSEAIPHRKAGLLAPLGDAEGIAAAIRETMEDPAGTAVRALAARRIIEDKFDCRRNAAELLSCFRSAAKSAEPMECRA